MTWELVCTTIGVVWLTRQLSRVIDWIDER